MNRNNKDRNAGDNKQPVNQHVASERPSAKTFEDNEDAVIDDVDPTDDGSVEMSELESLKNLLNQKEEEIEKEKKEYLFLMAEFDNFRKRTEKEKSAMFETGAKSVIEKILPVVDNFERGLAAVPESEKGDAFVQGMEMIYKQILTELESIDVKPIEAVGKEFDPEFHNAVMQVESEEYESGIVAQELQKGYTYRDSVVRHSMVAVVC